MGDYRQEEEAQEQMEQERREMIRQEEAWAERDYYEKEKKRLAYDKEMKEELRIEKDKPTGRNDIDYGSITWAGSETEFIDITTFEEPTGNTVLLEVPGKGKK